MSKVPLVGTKKIVVPFGFSSVPIRPIKLAKDCDPREFPFVNPSEDR
jgi:hypothetical protein